MISASFLRSTHRLLPHTAQSRKEMLDVIGVSSQEELFATIPDELKRDMCNTIPAGVDEMTIVRKCKEMAKKNLTSEQCEAFFLGGGSYRHHVPSVVDHLVQRSEFMTPYTPYQAEVSQGTLQSLFEFQTLCSNLSAMDFANCSMYDGATSAMEGAIVATRTQRKSKILLHSSLHPHWIETIETAARHNPKITTERFSTPFPENWNDVACVVMQNPAVDGSVFDMSRVAEEAHKNKALLVSGCAEIASLGLIKPPGEMGADIFAGEGSSLGSTMNFGGPMLGIFAGKNPIMRQAPGRLVGETTDKDGNRCYCLTLAAREQHIKREKATSNICTASSLLATSFSIHLSLLGKEGFAKMAKLNHYNAITLAKKIGAIPGVKVETDRFFNEFTVRLPKAAEPMVEKLADEKILCGVPYTRLYQGFDNVDEKKMLMAATELSTVDEMDKAVSAIKRYLD